MFRVLFGKCFKIIVIRLICGYIWYIICGVENYFLILGDLLFLKYIRFKFYKNENVLMKLFEFLLLVNISCFVGVVFMVILVV